jgi:DNA-binding NtrC family response regulator
MAHSDATPEAVEAGAAHILVVEDDILIRVAVVEYFRECGFEVYPASNAEEARQVLDNGLVVHLVFTDVEMPGVMNGFALARWVKDNHPDIEVILTSGAAQMAADLSGRADFVAKPYNHSLLGDRIRKLLGR